MRSPEVAPWTSKRTFESVSSTRRDALDGGVAALVHVRDHPTDDPEVGVPTGCHVNEHVVSSQAGGDDPDPVTLVQVRARPFWPGHVDQPEDNLSAV